MLVDVHGDEELPYCFIAGSEGVPAWGERMQMMQVRARHCSAATTVKVGLQRRSGCQLSQYTTSHGCDGSFNCMHEEKTAMITTRVAQSFPKHHAQPIVGSEVNRAVPVSIVSQSQSSQSECAD
jgi:hypothetical protein